MARKPIKPQPFIQGRRFVRRLLGDIRQFPRIPAANGGNDNTAVTYSKVVDASTATVAAAQTKRDAAHTANKKAKVREMAAGRLARARPQFQRQMR